MSIGAIRSVPSRELVHWVGRPHHRRRTSARTDEDRSFPRTAATTKIDYADWMGTKHLSAIEVSVREEVVAAITLSEENDRMTVSRDGTFEDYKRDELGGRWRSTRDIEEEYGLLVRGSAR